MSQALTYGPAYLGLFACLVLGIGCNAFLDIRFGTFGFEMLAWSLLFACTLWVGWRQGGVMDERGRSWQRGVLVLGAALVILIFLPRWNLMRTGLYLLGMLQAAMNCGTVTRRSLHFGLMVSLIMVIFAATHYRADWTMLFYLLPYVVAAVYTLVAEQISRRAQDLRRESLGAGTAGGQGMAIAAATGAILLVGGMLYALTPQVSVPTLFWDHAQPGRMGSLGIDPAAGRQASPAGTGRGAGGTQGGSGGAAGAGSRWPTIEEMRDAARRPGMPRWQAAAIEGMVGLASAVKPLRLGLEDLAANLARWLREHRAAITKFLSGVIILALLAAAFLLLRETRPLAWLRAYLDYLRLGVWLWHGPGIVGARQYYRAMERLLDIRGLAREPTANAREYLAEIRRRFDHLGREATELTLMFERARYGGIVPDAVELARMRTAYKKLFLAGASGHPLS